jgi:serine/threonine-protein kinase
MIGQRLAHYEILSALGRGGMGEVWRARDGKLGREVAIKTLPNEYARDPERLARFEREARFLATLDHPNVAGIHGLEQSGDTRFLVLELVEGQTLAECIQRTAEPSSPRQTFELALQIALALEAAHEKGVVHRDLKPANIKVTPSGQVKVLDFGLAKALDAGAAAGGASNISNSPTLSRSGTQQGTLMGTAAYMSPEQARGEDVDSRADIWAFGCVLFEALTGQRAFDGRTVSDILASVLKSEPDWTRLPPDLDPRIRFLLERCLRKDARERCPRIAELRVEIEKVLADRGGTFARPAVLERVSFRSRVVWAGAVILTALIGVVGGRLLWSSGQPLPLMRFAFAPAEPFREIPDISVVAFAPDGSRLAYSTFAGLYVRGIDEIGSVAVPGPKGWIGTPAFSPDGGSIAYVNSPAASGPFSIMRVPVGGGTPDTLRAGLKNRPTALDWDSRNRLLYVQPDGIWEASASGGGDARLVIAAKDGEVLAGPHLLPDGKSVLFSATTGTGPDRWDRATIFAGDLGSDNRTMVRQGGSDARYVSSGHLIFADGTTLWAVPFNPGSHRIGGDRFRVLDQVQRSASGDSDTAQYSVSESGAIVYLGPAASADPSSIGGPTGGDVLAGPRGLSLVWVDRMGKEQPLSVRPDQYSVVRISPDGKKAALVIGGNAMIGEPRDIWILDFESEDLSRVTTDGQSDAPVWLGNDQLIFRTAPVPVGIYSVPVGGGKPKFIAQSTEIPTAYPMALAPNRQSLLILHAPTVDVQDILTLALDGSAKSSPMLADAALLENGPVIAPNGKYMAYQEGTDVTSWTIKVRPYPDVGLRSYTVGPGHTPVFSRDGSELFYYDGQSIVAVPVKYDPFDIGAPKPLGLTGPYFYQAGRSWDEGADGRFLMMRIGSAVPQGQLQVHVAIGFSGVLKERSR